MLPGATALPTCPSNVADQAVPFGRPSSLTFTRYAAGANSRTRSVSESTTHRSPVGSKNVWTGLLRFVLLTLPGEISVKLGSPTTTEGRVVVLTGARYSRTRSLPASATQRSPFASKESPHGYVSSYGVVWFVRV